MDIQTTNRLISAGHHYSRIRAPSANPVVVLSPSWPSDGEVIHRAQCWQVFDLFADTTVLGPTTVWLSDDSSAAAAISHTAAQSSLQPPTSTA